MIYVVFICDVYHLLFPVVWFLAGYCDGRHGRTMITCDDLRLTLEVPDDRLGYWPFAIRIRSFYALSTICQAFSCSICFKGLDWSLHVGRRNWTPHFEECCHARYWSHILIRLLNPPHAQIAPFRRNAYLFTHGRTNGQTDGHRFRSNRQFTFGVTPKKGLCSTEKNLREKKIVGYLFQIQEYFN